MNDHSSTIFGAASGFWFLAVCTGLVFGAVVGGLSAALLVGLKMRVIIAALLVGIVNLIVVVWFLGSTNPVTDIRVRFVIYSLVPLGLIQGAIISFCCVPNQSLE